ncbi:Sushi domain-containing protein [Caenorhabditis elegans]|uniref:Sushi domain-containing protein n=1 Tax=Caenorhabditis elegans TaxID=6239 RepID=H2L2F4_CAEEL|nr:Sushi domain-containing protein [Caenorhabditis elegans]CCE72115.1 Sushi domain-containing protein [Caenorhabditis elegans]|eukprot:NP_001251039.1 Uncharacterized protein CELE_F36H2.3 [Caenorhabditis elegans]
MKIIIFCFILATLTASVTFGRKCDADLKPEKLVVVGVWKRGFDNSTAQYRISDEDLSVRGYERTESDKGSSTVMLARHPEGCVINECGVRLSAMMQNNGAILHTDYRMIRMNDSTMNNIEDEFYCAEKNNFCGADVPIYRLVKHSLTGPHYAYTFNDVGQSLPGYEKEFFPLCFAWRQTPSVVLFNSTDDGVCLTLPEVQNGKILYSNDQLNVFSIGTSATLECHQGFAGNGPSSLVCTKNGWYPKREDLGSCVRLEQSNKSRLLVASDVTPTSSSCRVPSSTPNGNIVYSANVATSTSINSVPTATRATVLCSLGHVPTTSVTSSKCVDGEWEPSLPTCLSLLDIKCPILSAPRNGELVFTNSVKSPYSLNSVISLKCDRNYFGTGNLTSTCTSTGWDQKIGQCEPVGIRRLSESHRYRIRRQASTGAVCAAIANPANGNLLYMQSNPTVQYSSGTSAYLMCNLGYSLSGSVSTLCSNGVWSPSIGQCTNALALGQTTGNCEAIPTRINGTITYSSFGTYTSGTIATLACNLMNTVSGSSTSTCLSGVWNPTIGNCVSSGGTGGTGTTCPNPTVINGQITYNQGNTFDITRPAGTTATLTCSSGYTVSGTSVSTCTNGIFTPTLGTCTLGSSTGGTGIQCTAMIAPLGGSVIYSNGGTMGPFPSGTTVTGSCTNGGAITGASTATCSNGMWNPTFLGTCSLIGGSTTGQCSALTIPSGAQATYSPFSLSTTSFTSGTVATVTCTTGGSMLGTSTCTNGLWSPAIMGTCSGTGTGNTCSALTRPVGETVTYDGTTSFATTFNSGVIARVTCSNGTQIGQSTCLVGQWTPAITATCSGSSTAVGSQCIGVIVPTNAQVTYSDGSMVLHSAGTTATLTCLNSATLTGSSYSSCSNGVWTPTLGSCTSSGTGTGPCYTPPLTPVGATLTYSSGYFAPWTAGSTATMSCPAGQTVIGTSISYCTNSAWSPALGSCSGSSVGQASTTTTTCSFLPIAPPYGSIVTSQTAPFSAGTMVTLQCDNGYQIQGNNATSTCTNGVFSEITATCIKN